MGLFVETSQIIRATVNHGKPNVYMRCMDIIMYRSVICKGARHRAHAVLFSALYLFYYLSVKICIVYTVSQTGRIYRK